MSKPSEYQVKFLGFQMFCERRGWELFSFKRNDKNSEQFIARSKDDNNQIQTFVISKTGRYLQYFGKEAGWKEISYVLEEE